MHNPPPRELLESPVPQPTEEMAAQPAPRPLKSYAIPLQYEPHNSIFAPPIEANNFELKPYLFSAVQHNRFSGGSMEDPNLHLSIFL